MKIWYYMKLFSLDIWLGKMNLKITLSIRLLDPSLLATCRVTLDLFTEIFSLAGYMVARTCLFDDTCKNYKLMRGSFHQSKGEKRKYAKHKVELNK